MHAWEFKGQNVAIETVTARALPPLLDAMGSSAIRYLRVLVPHLSDLLATTATAGGDGTWTPETSAMLLAASRALVAVIKNARLRIARWQGKIGVAISQCWIGMHESQSAQAFRVRSGEDATAMNELEASLKGVLKALDRASDTPVCPVRYPGRIALGD